MIHVRITGTGPWTVQYCNAAGALLASRDLAVGPTGWPLPPEAGLGGTLAGTQPDAVLTKLAARQLLDIAPLGEYLFDVLFGGAWSLVKSAADEIHLHVPSDARAMGQPPWEFVRNGEGFLLRARTLVRRVTRDAGIVATARVTLSAPPSVLFIVGARATDPDIRPGAEYLGILRQARGLRTHLLLQATETQIREALASFKPDVVHFICHGEVGIDRVVIKILEDDQLTTRPLDASNLDTILRHNGGLPPVVVFNACATGAPLALKGVFPLAGELVRRGVPLAIGMSGSVDDQASRVFARAWYGALAAGHDLISSASKARSYMEARTSARDWGLLTLFLRDDVMEVKASPSAAADEWRAALDTWHLPPRRPIHVGRWRQLHVFDQFLGSSDLRRATLGRDVRVLALRALTMSASPPSSPRLGCTYLCKELAARASAQGHLVVHLTAGMVKQLGQSLTPSASGAVNLGLVMHKLWERLSETARAFGVTWQSTLVPTGTAYEDVPFALEQGLTAKRAATPTASDWAISFRTDLATLATALARRSFAGGAARIVFIVDDLQALHLALVPLLQDVLRMAITVPSVCAALVLKADKIQDANAVTLDEWIGDVGVGLWLDLQRFTAPSDEKRPAVDEAWLAHRHNLLTWHDNADVGEAVALVPRRAQTLAFLADIAQSPGDFEFFVFTLVQAFRAQDEFDVGNDDRALKDLLS